jgi:tetratricopeptide (TPR) repeat protein
VAAEWRQGLPQAARLLNDWARRVAPAERRVVEPDEGRRGAARASSRGSLELSPVEARASVERQVAGILDALRGGHRARAEGYLEDLRRFQAEEPAYLVQTLCRLAAETERTDPAWALERLEEAVQVAPDDAFAWSQLATAYRRRGRLDEALNASRKGVAFGSDSQVATQHAEVLKGLGRLDEALAAYEKIIERFPHEVVPLNGRAEVLKALGRLDEALAAYEQTAERFSPEVVPRNGRAEVLKALGRLDEALAAYEETVDLFRQEVVPRNGRADVLKALGRLDEALAVYEETVDLFPREVIPRNGRAEVLKALGRLGESLAAYEEAVDLFPQEVVPRNGRAEVLKALGRLHEALAAYEETIDRFPQDVVARTGRAGILLAMRRPAEARAIFNDVLRSWPDDSYARTGRAMAFLMERRWADAREALRLDAPPRTEGDWVLLRLSGIVELRVGNLDAAERILTHVVRETPWAKARESARQALELVRLRRNRAPQAEAGLRAMGRPADRTACCSWLLLLAAAVATQNRKREAAALVAEVQHDAAPEIVATRTALIRVFGLGSGPPDRAESENLFDAQVMLLAA